MIVNKEKLDQEILNRLQAQGILLSNQVRTLNRFEALVLLGEAMLDKFVKEFVSLWKEELFAHCRLQDFELSAVEKQQIPGIQDPFIQDKHLITGNDLQPQPQQNINSPQYQNEKRVVQKQKPAGLYVNSYRNQEYQTFYKQQNNSYMQRLHKTPEKHSPSARMALYRPARTKSTWPYHSSIDANRQINLYFDTRKWRPIKPPYRFGMGKARPGLYRSLESYLKQCKEVEET